MKTPDELKRLKEKMMALQSGDFTVEAENPRIVKCWERLNCGRKDCPAYGKLRCWSIVGTSCHGEVLGQFAHELGDCRKCAVYKESCRDDIGELIEVFNQMAKDIRYTVEERIRSGQEIAAEERFAELKDMAAGVAHETRNPLHSIGMATSFLKKKYKDDLMSEFLTIIEDEVRKLNELTAIFLDFSHPRPINIDPCDINSLVQSAIDDFSQPAANRNLSILFQKDDKLVEFFSDSSRIMACISSLLENAMEASADGEDILVRTKSRNGMAAVSVQDNGPGIPAAEREKIFKPFYTTKTHGPGLGLAVVERSVKELQGQVDIDSVPGKGAIFTFLLPMGTKKS